MVCHASLAIPYTAVPNLNSTREYSMDVVKIAQQMIAIESVTANCNAAICEYQQQLLEELGFELEMLPYVDAQGIAKTCLAARRGPTSTPLGTEKAGIGFFAHNDVVSVEGWNCAFSGPFEGMVAEGRLWGRGACDMKGPTAAALAAIARVEPAQQTAPIYFFLTGDEESGMTGARLLADTSAYFAEMVDQRAVGIIGEPTSLRVVHAHKGGCHLNVSSQGVAAHSSTAQGLNANWQLIPFLASLAQLRRRCESEPQFCNLAFDPPTLSLNIVIENQPSSSNITVGRAICRIFFRPMPDTDWRQLLAEIRSAAEQHGLEVSQLPPLPPLCTPTNSPLVQSALGLLGQTAPVAVSYATDGCCFQSLPELIVIGPGNIEQAHRADEWIELEQLLRGVEVYQQLFEHYATAERLTN
jgi:acetylornithine deacetylase